MKDAAQRGLKARIRAGDRLLGSLAFLPSPTVVEILGRAGLDFVIIDQEHTGKSWETVENMVRAAEVSGAAALVRVAHNESNEILQALELNAEGIVIPFVEDAAAVERAAAAIRYLPSGHRGTCTQTRAARYGGLRRQFVEHALAQNERIALIGLIESRRGVDNIDAILAVQPGLDAVFIGRSDLASDFGKPGQTGNAAVEAATTRVIERCRAAGVAVAIAQYSAEECVTWAARGCSVFVFPSESGLLYNAVQAACETFAVKVRGG